MAAVYVGLAISVSLLQANHDAKVGVVVAGYFALALGGALAAGIATLRRSDGYAGAKAVRAAALASLAGQLLFLPVGLAVFSV